MDGLVLHQNVLRVWEKIDLLSLLQSKPSQQIIPQVGNTGTGCSLFTTAQQWPFSHSRPPDDKDNNVLCSIVYCNHWTCLKGQEEFAKLNNTRWQLLLHFYLLIYGNWVVPFSQWVAQLLGRSQSVKKFPTFYGTRTFITTVTSARHLSLSWAISIQSIPQHPTSCRSILILYSHPRLGLPSGLFPSDFPT